MSIREMAYVWEHSPLSSGRLLVHLALADFANDEGECWPSTKRLAQKSRLSTRQVNRVLRSLAELGQIELPDERSRDAPILLRHIVPDTGVPSDETPVSPSRARQDGVEPSIDEPPVQQSMLDDPVTEVWDHYVERLKRPRAKLDAKTRKWIADAIKACGVEECKRAISGLAVSEHHREGGWLGIEYALKPKAGQSIQSRVEMMAAKAPRSAGGSTVVKDLLAAFSPSQRERVASKMLDVRRRNMDPDSSMLKDIGDAAEEWLRVQANIVVVSSEGGQITWGRA